MEQPAVHVATPSKKYEDIFGPTPQAVEKPAKCNLPLTETERMAMERGRRRGIPAKNKNAEDLLFDDFDTKAPSKPSNTLSRPQTAPVKTEPYQAPVRKEPPRGKGWGIIIDGHEILPDMAKVEEGYKILEREGLPDWEDIGLDPAFCKNKPNRRRR